MATKDQLQDKDTKRMTIYESITKVMRDVGAVKKGERNNHHNFNFRGIDSVVNAVSPALKEHGVTIAPEVISVNYGQGTTSSNKHQTVCYLHLKVTWTNHDGDSLVTSAVAEAADTQDKATSKAHSVALRTILLQTLCLPTDEPDPDLYTEEQGSAVRPQGAPEPPRMADTALEEWVTQLLEAPDEDSLKNLYGQVIELAQHPADRQMILQATNKRKAELEGKQ